MNWSNAWGREKGYKAVDSAWAAPRSGHVFEVQFHTPAGKQARLRTHKLHEEQRLPSTSPARAQELQREQDRIFAAVPVPEGAVALQPPAEVVARPGTAASGRGAALTAPVR
ncbi:hypothetical protein ACFYMO_13065 [Streptomyces sp. NPDC007025]|uniref:hypothetical protein n=1 Tax=Streptomyces sp. NPDC007025 TaxID=3364771 RepID=UPI00369B830C